jgi:branched-chain amino acid transport system ATP-binding protein
VLRLEGVSCRYGGFRALDGATLGVGRDEFVALVGANGAGKTTLLRAISGIVKPVAGSITFEGQPIAARSPRDIVRLGIAHCPEERKLWPRLTVLENLTLGAYSRNDQAGIAADLDRVFTTFPKLAERRGQEAGTLSGGEQQMVAVGRALMSRPRLLMLDEPSLGLAPIVIESLFETIGAIHRAGTAILLVEQNAVLALGRAQRAYVIEAGAIVREGTGAALLADPSIQASYLGRAAAPSHATN